MKQYGLAFLFLAMILLQVDVFAENLPVSDSMASIQQADAMAEVKDNSFVWGWAFVPGAAQIRRGDVWPGVGYIVGMAGSLGTVGYFNMSGDDSFAKYKKDTDAVKAQDDYNQAKSSDSFYTSFQYVALGIYTLNVIDAFLFKNGYSGKKAQNAYFPTAMLSLNPRKSQQIVLEWKI